MSIKLSIEITSPLGDDDRDLLSGIAVMTLAIANHEMAKNALPRDVRGRRRGRRRRSRPRSPAPSSTPAIATRICIAEAGHRGRHRFRTMAAGDADAAAPRAN